MKRNMYREDILTELLENAWIQSFGTVKQQARLLESRREQCSEREYHRVSEDKPPGSNWQGYRFCYDCDCVFMIDDLPYKVEQL